MLKSSPIPAPTYTLQWPDAKANIVTSVQQLAAAAQAPGATAPPTQQVLAQSMPTTPAATKTAAAPASQSLTAAQVASNTSAQPQLNTSVGVEPKESWSLKDAFEVFDYIGSIATVYLTLLGAWTAWQKGAAAISLRRTATRLIIRDLGIPLVGRYHCTGNSSTDEEVNKLTDSLATDSNMNAILVSGPSSVSKFLIAKSIAAKRDLPLLSIDCAQLANITPEIPPELLDNLAKQVAYARKRHSKSGVILVFDGIENLVSAGHTDFIDRLRRELVDPSSKLRSGKNIIIGTRTTGDQNPCDGKKIETLEALSKTFSKALKLEPPKTAEDRFQLLYSRILSFMRYEAPKTSAPSRAPTLVSRIVSPLNWFKAPEAPANTPHPYSQNYELPPLDQDFLRAIARAMPEMADDNRVTSLARAIVNHSVEIGQPLSGDDFRSFVLEYALDRAKGEMSTRQTSPSLMKRDAHAVICEAFVALALDRTVLALGVQARGGASYVCREQRVQEDSTIVDLLKEACIAKARMLSYSIPATTQQPLDAAGREIDALDKIFTSAVRRAAELRAKMTERDMDVVQGEYAIDVARAAEAALRHLFSHANKQNYAALFEALCPKHPSDRPSELTNGMLDKLVGAFDIISARSEFDTLQKSSWGAAEATKAQNEIIL